jgi:molybdopterin synthase sulfur carrier subunit
VLDGLVATYPGLRDQLLTQDGVLNRFVNVYLNDEDIRYLAELATPTGERDTIVILPAMAGGAS